MDLMRKIVAGNPDRKTRLHDEKGNLIPLWELRRLPRHVVEHMVRVTTGRLPRRPWLPSNFVADLERLVQPDWNVVEFGSGMSTLWLSGRVGSLHSIEHQRAWYDRIRAMLPHHVRYELQEKLDRYPDLSDHADRSVDLVVVDGAVRSRCVAAALPKLRPGGYLLLDNSDKDATGGDMREAERLVLEAASWHRFVTGLTVGVISAHQMLLARVD
ncbi:MAG: class I SAM-dependent methyltransferase [Gaiellaceae bacterium]